MSREILDYDILIVGGGPSGLSAAIQLKKLNADHSIVIIEKGSIVGANILSGCILDIRGISELIPDWRKLDFPIKNKVNSEKMLFLTTNTSHHIPIPKKWQNKENYIISLSELCISLAEYASNLGIEVISGFSANSILIEKNRVCGVVVGSEYENSNDSVEIRANQTIIAEGCRGSIARQVYEYFKLDQYSVPQMYGLGIKELWSVESDIGNIPDVLHTIGYPLYNKSYGGGFMYKYNKNHIAIGLVSSLDYKNPYFNPYEEFQVFKQHKIFKDILSTGKRVSYGARTVVEGGLQSIPKLSFPGGVLVGDSAGFLNVAKIKGVHNAIKSGILAAEAINLCFNKGQIEAKDYSKLFKTSWLYKDLHRVRNIRPAFKFGLLLGLFYSVIDYYIFKGLFPLTFKSKTPDNKCLKQASKCKKILYPKHDNKITFDISSSLELANIVSEEGQKNHILLKDVNEMISLNYTHYDSPETRYCPAEVYKIDKDNNANPILSIRYKNCIHCKACDIKDINSNIVWNAPINGNGPQYTEM